VENLSRDQHGGFLAEIGTESVIARTVLLATGIVDEKPALPSLREFIYRGAVRFCPICDGFEARDKTIGVLGPVKGAAKKALFLRTYSKDVVLLPLGEIDLEHEERRALQAAGLVVPEGPVADVIATGDALTAVLHDGQRRPLDILYPAMGARVRSQLATRIGARCNDNGCLYIDDHQRTSVPGLYAAGDVTTELHQLSVATGHAAIAATHIHNALQPNYR
jgi:thioredoxin reductase (NADPH)